MQLYRRIYDEETRSMTNLKPSGTLLNRGFSNGKYGIWGHDLGDLDMHAVYKGIDGVYGLLIDS